MEFTMSNNVALQNPHWKNSESFYRNVFGLKTTMKKNHLLVQSGNQNLFIMENGKTKGIVMEFYVKDVEHAKEYLLDRGCSVVKWEGKGRDCYMEDPFGLVFNLWEVNE